MACSQVEVSAALPPPVPGATHVFILDIWKAFPWSKSGAEAVASIADYLAGVEVFGYQLDMSSITGWDAVDVKYDDSASKIYIYFNKTGSPAIPPIMIGVIAILLILGLIITAWSFTAIGGSVIASVDNAQRSQCIKSYIDAGKTPDEALKLCPEKKEGTDWGVIAIAGAALVGLAYVLGNQGKRRR